MGMRARRVALVAALLSLALAGCASSGRPPSALDPARVVPANAIAYVELTVRPQGAQRHAAEAGLTKLLGHSPDADIQRAVEHALRSSGLHYSTDIEPWLGQRIGLVVTAFSLPGVAFIAPTSDPAAAAAALARGERRHGPFVTRSYDGVTYKLVTVRANPVALGTVGHYAVIGGTTAFKQIVDTYRGRVASLSPPASGALASAYLSTRRLVAAVKALPTVPPQVRQQLQTVLARAHLSTALTLSMSASTHAFTLDLRSLGAPPAHATPGGADVSALPGDSWLAISAGNSFSRRLAAGFNAGFIQGFSRAARASGVSPNALLQLLRQRTGIDLIHDLLPALGPFQFSVQGSTLTTLAAALALRPADPAAGLRLIGDIHNLVARDHSLRVTGGSRSFSFGPASVPIPLVSVSDLGREIVSRFALSAATHPSGRLSANPVFVRARSLLPAGSSVPLFLDFGPLAALLSQTPQFQASGSNHKAVAVLRRLDYFVVGTSAAEHDTRIVLGLH